jgi:ligand-binding SRPBCC domain-containing protein
MVCLSIITAVAPSAAPYVREAAASVLNLTPVPGWEVEWVVTADGEPCPEKTVLVDTLRDIEKESVGHPFATVNVIENPYRMWSGFSRNRALVQSTGQYVAILDGDDILTSDALAVWVRAITDHPDAYWWTFSTQDFYSDGSIVDFPDVWEQGPVAAGAWLEHYTTTGRHPRTPIGVVYTKDLLVSVGGWSAGGAGQDAHPTLSATSRAAGWCELTPTHLYRKHDAQITNRGADSPLNAMWQDTVNLAVATARLQTPYRP